MKSKTAAELFGNNSTGWEFLGSKKYPGDAFGAAFISFLVCSVAALIFWATASQSAPEKEALTKWAPRGIAIFGLVLIIVFLAIGIKNIT